MDVSRTAGLFVVNLVLPLALGYLLRRRGARLSESALDRVNTVNVLVLVTVLGLLAFWTLTIDLTLVWLPVIAVLSSLATGLLGWWRAPSQYADPPSRGGYILSTMISNRNTAGMLAAFLLLGEAGYAYARLFTALNWAFLFAVCYPVAEAYARHGREETARPAERGGLIRRIFNANHLPLVGMAVGLGLHAMGVTRPAIFEEMLPALVQINVWLFLIPLGYALDFSEMRKVRHDIGGLFVIKFLLSPLICYAFGRLFGLPETALLAVVILGLSPTAIQAPVVAQLFRLNHNVAMGAFVLSMLGFMALVVPLLVVVFPWLKMVVGG